MEKDVVIQEAAKNLNSYKELFIGEELADTKKLADFMLDELSKYKIDDLIIIDIHELSSISDILIIGTAQTSFQLGQIVSTLARKSRKAGFTPLFLEGLGSEWVVLDMNGVILHLFSPEARSVYNIESLWGEAPRLLVN